MSAGKFVGLLFIARDLTHRAHLKTKSYAQHVALGGFYEGIIPLADEFAEQYQGEMNELLDIPLLDNEFEGPIDDILEQQKDWIEKNREKIIARSYTSIHNTIDDVVSLYQSTIYKLRFLS